LIFLLLISCSKSIKFNRGDCFIKNGEKYLDELKRERKKDVEYVVLRVNNKKKYYLSASTKPSLEKIPFTIKGVKKSQCEIIFKK
jgi:hypothetical protein